MQTDVIFQEDCIRGMRRLPDNSVQVIVTSPPYNVKKGYKKYNDNLLWEAYYQFLRSTFSEAKRILKKKGLLFINISNSIKNQHKAYDLARAMKSIGFYLIDSIIWHKPNPQPINSNRLLTNAYEFILVFAKSPDYQFYKESIKVPCRHSDGLKCRTNVWSFNVVHKNQFTQIDHCAMFPEELPRLCILLGSRPNDTVLDPFMGSGTTAVAAKRLGRHYIGFEISKEYIKMCEKRIAEVQP